MEEDQSKETPAPIAPEVDDPRLPQAAGGPVAEIESEPAREPGDGQEGAKAKAKAAAKQTWSPDSSLVEAIVGFGFSKTCAEKALFYTGNQSADQAVGWILDHPEAAEDPRSLELEGFSSSDDSDGDQQAELHEMLCNMGSNYKMVFVINSSLKMGLGKVAAQVGHATLGLYKRLLDRGDAGAAALSAWDTMGETKIVLKGNDDKHLMELQDQTRAAGLPSYLVQDAGRTQIPSGSITVLSVFGPAEKVDPITKDMKLI